ncbi:FAD:protein FMN transferase [Falsochrobactrum sp. TDYN1]|uniref:FAD:protein FMN transferase n=1 Tax=Falsochrobactrum tianjinense TaxID=2706015 RepID=A0A949PN24_9HYPH|nr:FAD:protein FMN transferase [Falsochrobactrum sp. TDYN1]MBV2143672.1 FAD:protein FMN transferase [Falsochrobactrum sp. TDYN1]
MHINRRLVLAGSACAMAFLAIPRFASASGQTEPLIWKGQALGAPAKIMLHHRDRGTAQRLLHDAVREAERLENIFSLYRADSELMRLNRVGALAMPSPELMELLAICRECWELSDGMFDPTVQPLWQCLYKHFSQADPDPFGPTRAQWDAALEKVGFSHVLFNETRIAFTQPSMALTLNGIAQGYITDRIVSVLEKGGVRHGLVDMGEYRVIGTQPGGKPWRIGIANLETDPRPVETLDIRDQALATSSFSGFQFDEKGRFNHLLNPKTGYSSALYRRVSVIAPSAATADAWATAFNLMDVSEIKTALGKLSGFSVHIRTRGDENIHLGA